jgi:hypothetical protein
MVEPKEVGIMIVRSFISGTLAIIAGVGFLYGALPWINEINMAVTCSEPSPPCLVRARAQGHVWSDRGDLNRARKWYAWGAEQGDRIAMFHLAWVEEQKGSDILSRTPLFSVDDERKKLIADANLAFSEAALWYRQSAERGFAPAMNNLGGLQAEGLGLPRDTRSAYQWYRAAARAANPVGILNLASAYFDGETDGSVEAMSSWSEIAPWKAAAEDLQEPTFGRTLWKGKPLPDGRRDEVRQAAKTQAVFPLQHAMHPDARLPIFHREERDAPAPRRE